MSQYLAVARWTIPRKLLAKLVVAGGDGAVDLQLTEHAFDAITLLVERGHARFLRDDLSDLE